MTINKQLYENLMERLPNIINEALNTDNNRQSSEDSDFRIFIEGMHAWMVQHADGPGADIKEALPGLKVTEMGIEKMFKFAFSENDEYLQILIKWADDMGYAKFRETVTRNSIEAKKRYQQSHICRKYIVATTCGWPCTIKATEDGWKTEFGYDGDHYEEVEGHTPQENFQVAYDWACEHYGPLMPAAEYEKASEEEIKEVIKKHYENKKQLYKERYF